MSPAPHDAAFVLPPVVCGPFFWNFTILLPHFRMHLCTVYRNAVHDYIDMLVFHAGPLVHCWASHILVNAHIHTFLLHTGYVLLPPDKSLHMPLYLASLRPLFGLGLVLKRGSFNFNNVDNSCASPGRLVPSNFSSQPSILALGSSQLPQN